MIAFSVVTITYNAAQVLQPTLDSVLMQDYPHVEHLIIDGASTDNTVAIAEAYRKQSGEAENGHTVRIQSEPDNGLYDAMNKGLQLATGDYVVFLNAGDRFPAADTLDRVVLAAVVGDGEERPAVLFGDTDIIDGKGNFLCHRRLTPPARLTWRSFRYGMLDWCIRVMKEGERRGLLLRNIHAVVADYVQEGQTTLHHKESLRERFDVMRRHYGLLQTVLLHAWFAVRSLVR